MAFGTASNEGHRYSLVRSTSFGKRVAITNVTQELGCFDKLSLNRFNHCSVDSFLFAGTSLLETLPQDVLVRVLCGVNHDDLKSLFHMSKSIKEAGMIAKQLHFEYSTPRKTVGFQSVADIQELSGELSDIEAPNAPKQSRIRRSMMSRKDLSDISVALLHQTTKRFGRGGDILMGTEKHV